MPLFELTPVDLSHHDWQASTHKNRCRIHAPDEESAKVWANAEFDIAAPRSAGGDIALPPWPNPERTVCEPAVVSSETEYREGRIEVWRGDGGGTVGSEPLASGPIAGGGSGRWEVVKEGLPPDDEGALQRHFLAQDKKTVVFKPGNTEPEEADVESGDVGSPTVTQQAGTGGGFGSGGFGSGGFGSGFDADGVARGAGQAAGTSTAEAVGTATLEITQQTVTYVIQNRAAIGGQTSLLLKLLDSLDGLDDDPQRRRNYTLRDALGLNADINENELSELLRSLRDEVRLLREALENQSVDPTTLERLRDIGLDNLRALNRNHVFVTMEAVGLGSVLWTLLSSLGVMDTNLAMEALRLILDR